MSADIVRYDGVDAAALVWDGLAGGLTSSANWLRTAEALANVGARCTVLSQDGLPRSGDVSWETEGNMWVYNDPVALLALGGAELAGYLASDEADEITHLSDDLARDATLYPARVSVLPSGYRPGLVLGSPDDLVPLVEDLEADGTPTTAVMHVDDADPTIGAFLRARGYVPLCTAGDCVLELDSGWSTIEDYAAAAKGRRKRLRRESSAFNGAGARVRAVGLEDLGPEHAWLHAAHLRRYGHNADAASSQQLLDEIRRHPTGRPLVLEVVEGDTVTGFLVAYAWDGELMTSMVGLSSQAPYAYFSLVLYEPVRWALAEGLARIRFGPGTYAAKRQRGCTVHALTSWVRVPPRRRAAIGRLAELLGTGYRREMGLEGEAVR